MRAGDRITLGKRGERLAVESLKRAGYKIVSLNYKTPFGEIDAVAEYEGAAVFIETKTRLSPSLGPPYLSITPRKKRKIIQNALYYLSRHGCLNRAWRIDVVSVKMRNDHEVEYIELIKNAVEDEGD